MLLKLTLPLWESEREINKVKCPVGSTELIEWLWILAVQLVAVFVVLSFELLQITCDQYVLYLGSPK